MSKAKRGKNSEFLKDFNQSLLLDIVRTHRAISKAQLSVLVGLTPTAVGKIADILVAGGYLKEKGQGDSNGGRKPVLLELNPRSYYSIGFSVDVNSLQCVMLDIAGEIILKKNLVLASGITFAEVIDKINKTILSLIKKYSIDDSHFLGVGISLPGLVDPLAKKLLFSPNMGWMDVDMNLFVPKLSTSKVFFENEANASAIAENWFGSCASVENFICLNVKSGIGAGIFINGKLYVGSNGYAGEVGHTVFFENDAVCKCGNTGCIETQISLYYIKEKIKSLMAESKIDTTLNSRDEITPDAIIEEARKGDPFAASFIEMSATYAGILISDLINSFNPSKVVLGEDFLQYGDLAMDRIRLTVSKRTLKYLRSSVEIECSHIGKSSSAIGAAAIPMKQLFNR
jgi:N-acetylglucosamine repressor